MVSGGSAPYIPDPRNIAEEGWTKIVRVGRAGCVGGKFMVRPLKMEVLLLSVHPLPDQCLLH